MSILFFTEIYIYMIWFPFCIAAALFGGVLGWNGVKIWFDYGWTNPADGCEDVETSKSSAFANSGQCYQSPILADISCSVAMWEIELIVKFPGYCTQGIVFNVPCQTPHFMIHYFSKGSAQDFQENHGPCDCESVRYFLAELSNSVHFLLPCVLLCEISEYARIDRIPNMHECSILGQQRLQHRCGTWIDWKILGEWIWTRFKVAVRGPRPNIHQVRNKAFFSIFPRHFRGHSPHFEHPISLVIIVLGPEN